MSHFASHFSDSSSFGFVSEKLGFDKARKVATNLMGITFSTNSPEQNVSILVSVNSAAQVHFDNDVDLKQHLAPNLRKLFNVMNNILQSKEMKLGNIGSIYNIGILYQKWDGHEDPIKACYYLKIADDQGHARAMNDYGEMLRKGDGTQANPQEACRYYKMATDQSEINGMNNYGQMLLKGIGVPVNKQEGIRYLKMAADQGQVSAMNNYASILRTGDGTQADP
ncbi:hypothetical protein M9Y10_035842 [Tritrichomonas musculus]|uniref:HCP-like protein n=1 Tax=Tritrichomonas musculus TaxID=1915356 RepID=A0ABR2GW71_9EUKA